MNFDNHNINADDTKALVIGKSAMIFNICMYAAPAQNIVAVFKTKDPTLIPVHTSIIGFLCSSTWFIYGLLDFDINVLIPNVLGIIFTVFQIGVWIYCKQISKVEPGLQEFIGETKSQNA